MYDISYLFEYCENIKKIKIYVYRIIIDMLLPLLIVIPFLGGCISWKSEKINAKYPKIVALFFVVMTLFLSLVILLCSYNRIIKDRFNSIWIDEFVISWIPQFGIEFHLGIDNLSLIMILFTSFFSLIAVLCSWSECSNYQGFFYFSLLCITACTMGIFLSLDLFLFFLFWECVLIPIYFIVLVLGLSDNKFNDNGRIASSFFIYSQFSGLILLASILGLVYNCYNIKHIWTFDYNILINIPLNFNIEFLLMLGFFSAFIIKMPIVPLHSWLPNLNVQLPRSGSIDILGFLLKTSVYGLLRFCIPLFPNVYLQFSYIGFFLGVVTIIYSSLIAYVETNIKRLIAYASISHMGIILIGIFANNTLSYQGLIVQMLSNAISTAGLFILSGQLYKRLQTYNIYKIKNSWKVINWIPGFLLFFSISNCGIPGTGNFIGEFLILLGIFNSYPIVVYCCFLGLLMITIYSLNLIYRMHYGELRYKMILESYSALEFFIVLFLSFCTILIGIYPKFILDILL